MINQEEFTITHDGYHRDMPLLSVKYRNVTTRGISMGSLDGDDLTGINQTLTILVKLSFEEWYTKRYSKRGKLNYRHKLRLRRYKNMIYKTEWSNLL